MPEVLSVASQHLPLTQAVVDFKVGLFRSRGRLGRAFQAAGSYALPGDTTVLSPHREYRSVIYQGLTPGGGSAGGGLGRRIGGASRRFRCPPGYEHGGRFANRTLSNCGSRLFDAPGNINSPGGRVAGAAGAAARRAIRGLGTDPGNANDLDIGRPNLRSPIIQRAASIPEVGAFSRSSQSAAVNALVSDLSVFKGGKKRLVRRDGFVLVPVASTERLSTVRRNPDMQDAVLVVGSANGDIDRDDLNLLFSGNVRGLSVALGNGAFLSLTTNGKLSTAERNAVLEALRSVDLPAVAGLSEAIGGVSKVSFSGKFPGITRPYDRLTVESGNRTRIVPRWVYELFLAPSAPGRGKRPSWKVVQAGKVYDLPLSAVPASERQAALEFKVAVHETRSAFSAVSIQYKRVAAVWDRDLPPSGGFRCPPGTRYGGRITDRFGRNCGWGVTRRLANALEGGGRNLGERLDARRDRQAGNRVRRGAQRAERQAERQGRRVARAERRVDRAQERLDRARNPRARVGTRPRRRDAVADRLDAWADRQVGPKAPRAEKPKRNRRSEIADRLDNWADRQAGPRRPKEPKTPKRNRRGELADRLDNWAERQAGPRKPKPEKKPKRNRRGEIADRLDRFANRMNNPPERRRRSERAEPDLRKEFMDQHEWEDKKVSDLTDDELNARITDLRTEHRLNDVEGNEDPHKDVRDEVLNEYRDELNKRRRVERSRLAAERRAQEQRQREEEQRRQQEIAEAERKRRAQESLDRRQAAAEENIVAPDGEIIDHPEAVARRERYMNNFLNAIDDEDKLNAQLTDLRRNRDRHLREAQNEMWSDEKRLRSRQLAAAESDVMDRIEKHLAEREKLPPGERFKADAEREVARLRDQRGIGDRALEGAGFNEIDIQNVIDDIDDFIKREELRADDQGKRGAIAAAKLEYLRAARQKAQEHLVMAREANVKREKARVAVEKIHKKKFDAIKGDREALTAEKNRLEKEIANDRKAAGEGDVIDQRIADGRLQAHQEHMKAIVLRLRQMDREEKIARGEKVGDRPEVFNRGPERAPDVRRGQIADNDGAFPVAKEIVNPNIQTEAQAIAFVKNGGSLNEVPNKFWLKAVSANSSSRKNDPTTIFYEGGKNGGIIGDTRIFVLRDADGKVGPNAQGWVFKAASEDDNLGEVFGYAVAKAHGLYVEGPGADGFNDRGQQFAVLPHAVNNLPEGNFTFGRQNFDGELLAQDKDAFPVYVGHAIHDYLLGVIDRHPGNGLVVQVDGKAHVLPIDQGWAGRDARDRSFGQYLSGHMGGKGEAAIRNAFRNMKAADRDRVRARMEEAADAIIEQAKIVQAMDAAELKAAVMPGLDHPDPDKLVRLQKYYSDRLDRLIAERDTILDGFFPGRP